MNKSIFRRKPLLLVVLGIIVTALTLGAAALQASPSHPDVTSEEPAPSTVLQGSPTHLDGAGVDLAPSIVSIANEVTLEVVSDNTVDAYGPVETEPSDNTTWGVVQQAVEIAGLFPGWTSISDAKWISTSETVDNATVNSWRKFHVEFSVPCIADNVTGALLVAADNATDSYFNGSLLGSWTQFDNTTEYQLSPQNGLNSMDFIVLNIGQTGATPESNPTGLIFKATIQYDLPTVVWQPPATHSGFALKEGSTLPLKFRLYSDNGTALIENPRNVYLILRGPLGDGDGIPLVKWGLGQGISSLRFHGDLGQYIANFKTRNYELVDGARYVAEVHDGCTDSLLGAIEFTVSSAHGVNRGNSPGIKSR